MRIRLSEDRRSTPIESSQALFADEFELEPSPFDARLDELHGEAHEPEDA